VAGEVVDEVLAAPQNALAKGAKAFDHGTITEAHEDKAKYQPARRAEVEEEPAPAPAKAAGYAPIEPRPGREGSP
jgi:hypothetical protein